MYKILIKDKENLFRYLCINQEISKDKMVEVTDPQTREVRCICQKIPTGEYKKVIFEAKTLQAAEDMAKEVLKTYNMSQFRIVDELNYDLDMLFKDNDGDIIDQSGISVPPSTSDEENGES